MLACSSLFCSLVETECPNSLVVSDCLSSYPPPPQNTGCLEFLVSSRVITCLHGRSKSPGAEREMGRTKTDRLIVREEGGHSAARVRRSPALSRPDESEHVRGGGGGGTEEVNTSTTGANSSSEAM